MIEIEDEIDPMDAAEAAADAVSATVQLTLGKAWTPHHLVRLLYPVGSVYVSGR